MASLSLAINLCNGDTELAWLAIQIAGENASTAELLNAITAAKNIKKADK